MPATTRSLVTGHITQGVNPGALVQDAAQITLTAATPTALNGGTSPTILALQGVTVQADPSNSGTVRVGGALTDATHGVVLAAGVAETFPVCDPATLFVYATLSGQKVNVQWV